MKFVIDKDLLLETLQRVQSLVNQRATLPILANVLIEAVEDKLILTTTDMEVTYALVFKRMYNKREQLHYPLAVFLVYVAIYRITR